MLRAPAPRAVGELKERVMELIMERWAEPSLMVVDESEGGAGRMAR